MPPLHIRPLFGENREGRPTRANETQSTVSISITLIADKWSYIKLETVIKKYLLPFDYDYFMNTERLIDNFHGENILLDFYSGYSSYQVIIFLFIYFFPRVNWTSRVVYRKQACSSMLFKCIVSANNNKTFHFPSSMYHYIFIFVFIDDNVCFSNVDIELSEGIWLRHSKFCFVSFKCIYAVCLIKAKNN